MAHEDRRDYVDRILEGDAEGARRVVERLMAEQSPERVIVDLLAPAQSEIGQRWAANRCSVADEHVATAITDAMLGVVAGAIAPSTDGPLIAVACAEGDWHTVPARMAAELLRAQGYRIRFLGGSLPADHLGAYLAQLRPAAVCLTCSLPLYLPGALRSIEAAHRGGLPVLAGGRGFGRDEHIALRLGADSWARSVTAAKRRLSAWSRRPPPLLASPDADVAAWSTIEVARPELVDLTMANLVDLIPAMNQFDERQLARTREDLGHIVQFLAVSLLVDDDRVFVEFLAWLDGVLTSRGLPASTVDASMRVLLGVLVSTNRATARIQRLLSAATGAPALRGAPARR